MILPTLHRSLSLSLLILLLSLICVEAQATVFYVKPGGTGAGGSWANAAGHIQATIFSAAAKDEIWVAKGIYNEAITLFTGVALYGGFTGTETAREQRDWVANETVIDAMGLNTRVVTVGNVQGTTFDGLTITGGNNTSDFGGGGFIFTSVTTSTLSNCTITGNMARNAGGGIYCDYSSPALIHCMITSNTATCLNFGGGGGVYCGESSSPNLMNCTITENYADMGSAGGGGVCCVSSSPMLMNCTITGNSTDHGGGGVYCGDNSSSTLTNCTITGNRSISGGGICCDYSSPTLTNCTITGNGFEFECSGEGGGVDCYESSSPTLTNCTITSNYGSGVSCYYDSSPTLTNCTITSNYGNGIFCYYDSSPTLTNCTITSKSVCEEYVVYGWGVLCESSSSPVLTNCTITNSTGWVSYDESSSPTLTNCILWNEITSGYEIDVDSGILEVTYSCVEGGYTGTGNISDDPLFVDAANGDYTLLSTSPCIDMGNPGVSYNDGCQPPGQRTVRNDMGYTGGPCNCGQGGIVVPTPTPTEIMATPTPSITFTPTTTCTPTTTDTPTFGPIWYVKQDGTGTGTSWDNAAGNIQSTIYNATQYGDEIWVASGIYQEAITMVTGTSLYGGFAGTETAREQRDWVANKTVIDASGLFKSVVTINDVQGTTLDGFIITGGHPTDYIGGGVSFSSVTSATLTNCAITGNYASYGGVSCWSSSPNLNNCTITGNNGGGVFGDYLSSLRLTNCMITDNMGSGVACGYSFELTNCTITGNMDSDGGGVWIGSHTHLECTNCLIAGNTATSSGGGVYCGHASFTDLLNCTIVGNTGGGVYCDATGSELFDEAFLFIYNSILWNPGGEVTVYGEDYAFSFNCTIRNSCVEGGYEGTGNIDSDPLFVDAANGDYTLLSTSPCIDAGEPNFYYNDGCLPPGQRTVRNDMGYTGGPNNCDQGGIVVPTPTPTLIPDTPTPTPTASSTPSFTPTITNTRTNPDVSIWYVTQDGTGTGTSWDNAAGNIQNTIYSADKYGGEIWVARGIYNEAITMATGTTLYGGFAGTETARDQRDWVANETVIDATGLYTSVVTVIDAQGTTLDGFTITGGNETNWGGGVCFSIITSATLTNCKITGNIAADYTGGVFCYISSPILTNCTITSNIGGGVCGSYLSSPRLTNCMITGNTAFSGGGVYCGYSFELTNCTITGNTARYEGGGVWVAYHAFMECTNCLIANNSAVYGGGVSAGHASFTDLTNCTITGNNGGGGIYCDASESELYDETFLDIFNSIIWNPGNEVIIYSPYYYSSIYCSISNSCIEGGYTGTGNIDSNPLFVDAANGNYHLQELSPCIGKGIGPTLNSLVPLFDIDGDPRSGVTCDMGADEFVGGTWIREWENY